MASGSYLFQSPELRAGFVENLLSFTRPSPAPPTRRPRFGFIDNVFTLLIPRPVTKKVHFLLDNSPTL